jgi:hypothetical protein
VLARVRVLVESHAGSAWPEDAGRRVAELSPR